MTHDPQYIEHILSYSGPIDSRHERTSPLKDKPDFALGFLLGKGLAPQEVFDILSCWWTLGNESGRRR